MISEGSHTDHLGETLNRQSVWGILNELIGISNQGRNSIPNMLANGPKMLSKKDKLVSGILYHRLKLSRKWAGLNDKDKI
jgi:hypothetical protein